LETINAAFDPGTPDGREKLLLKKIPIVFVNGVNQQP
jgi:hypothetical protein